MKELLRKKSVKISLLLIILSVVMGIIGINVQSAQKRKEYDAHIKAAEKYLSELDYEQAIAEYAMAYEIYPREEVVDALEQTYLAYAQTYIDSRDYERAISILEEGYEKIGRESLQNKIAEVEALREQKRLEEEQQASGRVELPFLASDITVMGYDLFEDHFDQLLGVFPMEGGGYWVENAESMYREGEGITSDGASYEITTDYAADNHRRLLSVYPSEGEYGEDWSYMVYYGSDGRANMVVLDINNFDYEDGRVFDYAGINVPVTVGESYEDWCRVMQINRMKENGIRPEVRDGEVGIWSEDNSYSIGESASEDCEYWLFSGDGYMGMYSEEDSGDGGKICELRFAPDSTTYTGYIGYYYGAIESISAEIEDGVIYSISYSFFV